MPLESDMLELDKYSPFRPACTVVSRVYLFGATQQAVIGFSLQWLQYQRHPNA